MELHFALFALLPLGLASLFSPRLPRSTAGFGFLAALAPFVAKGIGSLISHKQKQSADKQAEEARRVQAEQADVLAKQKWEEEQNSPAAQARRFKSKFAYGKLAGKMGGLDKVPKSLIDYYKSGYAMPEYSAPSSYIPTPKKGGGVWDFLGGVTEALPYIDTSAFKRPKASAELMGAGNAAAQSGALGALQGGGMATSIADLTQRLKQPRG